MEIEINIKVKHGYPDDRELILEELESQIRNYFPEISGFEIEELEIMEIKD